MAEVGDHARDQEPLRVGASRPPVWALVGMIACTLAALAATGALVYNHFSGKALPGCGPRSACADVESKPFGHVPFPDGLTEAMGMPYWPVSFLGLAYYAAVLVGVAAARGRIPFGLRAAIWTGAAVSVVYAGVILWLGAYCKYCIASHAANFGLLLFMEVGMLTSSGTSGRRFGWGSVGAAGAAFLLATGVLGAAERGKVAAAERVAQREMDETAAALRAKAEADRAGAAQPAAPALEFGPGGFTGRYRLGPEQAVVRIVVFSDYQCEYCKRIEEEARKLVEGFPGQVSLSAKHFPLNTDCNALAGVNLHRNACFAARTAEAVGLLKGNDGFWRIHHWMFERDGVYNDEQLVAKLEEMGVSVEAFGALFDSDAVKQNIKADTEQAAALGIVQTPMIFVNGVEFRNWYQPGKLGEVVRGVLQSGAPAVTAAADRPMPAMDKYVDDWRQERPIPVADNTPRVAGTPDAPVEVTVFGDYNEPLVAKVDGLVRGWIEAGRPIRYNFRHYPGDTLCNPRISRTFFPHGCLAARVAEGAGKLGGPEAFWKAHAWMMANQRMIGSDLAARVANATGLDPAKLQGMLQDVDVNAAIGEDVAAGDRLSAAQPTFGIPTVYVNGKWVRTWMKQTDGDILDRVITEASGEKK